MGVALRRVGETLGHVVLALFGEGVERVALQPGAVVGGHKRVDERRCSLGPLVQIRLVPPHLSICELAHLRTV